MMNFNEFKDYAAAVIKAYLPPEYENGEVVTYKVEKLGRSYTGMSVKKPDMDTAATVNLEQFYKEFVKGADEKSVLKWMAQVIMSHSITQDFSWITDYDQAKERLFIRVSSLSKNEKIIESVPHRIEEDMVMTCHLLVSNDDTGANTIVSDLLLKGYGISDDQLFQDALENSQKLFPIRVEPLQEMVCELAEAEGCQYEINHRNPMLVVTNSEIMHGASALFYPDTMEKIADLIEDDYYAVPSSIHEFIIIPESIRIGSRHLEAMLSEVNQMMVAPEDRLSDHIYHYDSRERCFELAEDYEMRRQLEMQSIVLS